MNLLEFLYNCNLEFCYLFKSVFHDLDLVSGDFTFFLCSHVVPGIGWIDCFSVCAFKVALSCLETGLLSTIQQADREGTFFCFPADGAALQVFVFSYPLCTSGMAVERCSFSLGKCHAPSGMVGPLSDQFTLVMGYHHYGGGMWRVLENLFCELLFQLCF